MEINPQNNMDNQNFSVPPGGEVPQMPQNPTPKNKWQLVLGGIVIVVLAVIVGFGINAVIHPFDKTPVLSDQNIIPSSNTAPTQAVQVQWVAPTIATSLHLFKDVGTESGAKYYKVGTFVTGDYKGGDIFIVTAPAEGPGGDSIYRFINQSGKITFVTKNSDQLYDGDFLDRSKFSIDNNTVLSDLVFPAKITYNTNSFSLEGDNINEPFFNQIYTSSDLKVAFVDSKLGNVFTDVPGEKTSKNGIKQNGFYLTASDGTLRTYSLDINFYDKNRSVPQVTWNDGTANTAEYTDTDRGGCGSRNYASVIYGLSTNDLVAIGKTSKGDMVYELKDSNNSILQKIYTNDYNPYNTQKISYSQFVQSKPVFFWFDSFGRLIKFQKSEFVPQAECGKPVIYLYPEKTTNVSVKIVPKGGLTKTEPNYGNGWNVLANPDGQLTDLDTGNIYPYLFWEGRGGIYTTPEKGFVINAKDVHSFLVEKLTKLGLNQKEQKDFIDFWEPRMIGAPYFFVTFLGNKEMDTIAPLTIIPKPDSVIRILMDFSPLQKPISAEGYEIKTPNRNGFTVVEWGGVLR